jgi:ABC-2 type transport system ATP-binding protein
VAALCRRVVIIAKGRIEFDGSLSGIVDSFSGHKIVTLQFAEDSSTEDLGRFGEVLEVQPPRARLRIDRSRVPRALAAILSQHSIEDVAVEDPPLEEVIADVFARANLADAADQNQPQASQELPT